MLRIPVTALLVLLAAVPVHNIKPIVETAPMPVDVDDPSIWVNPADAGKSLIVGTIKRPKPEGGVGIYNLRGELLDRIRDIDRPNNVDILGDICVLTERYAHQLRVYRVGAEKPWLTLLGTVPVFAGQTGDSSDPMGIALYRRQRDLALFAIVSRRMGPSGAYLWQYRLDVTGDRVTGSKVREFGVFSGSGQIEAVAVDSERELVYYADEDCCVRASEADPDKRGASQEVARIATTGFRANREGIAVAGPWIIVTDQLPNASEYHVYDRTDRREMAVWRGQSDTTDGIDAVSRPMGPGFPNGFLVAMNSARHTFHLYSLPSR
ncbi:MAG: phytase [Acidobacteriia bacterium]|nr:phytase [Terriglobia bacterium]